jgi:hypothetical protein
MHDQFNEPASRDIVLEDGWMVFVIRSLSSSPLPPNLFSSSSPSFSSHPHLHRTVAECSPLFQAITVGVLVDGIVVYHQVMLRLVTAETLCMPDLSRGLARSPEVDLWFNEVTFLKKGCFGVVRCRLRSGFPASDDLCRATSAVGIGECVNGRRSTRVHQI